MLLFTGVFATAQNIERIAMKRLDKKGIYIGDGDSQELHYLKIVPEKRHSWCYGLTCLVEARIPVQLLLQAPIYKSAFANGILVLVPSINWMSEKRIEEFAVLDEIFQTVIKQYQVPADKFVIGGFSNGGMIALKYAEAAAQASPQVALKPAGVFGVDTPLDKAHLYEYCEREIER